MFANKLWCCALSGAHIKNTYTTYYICILYILEHKSNKHNTQFNTKWKYIHICIYALLLWEVNKRNRRDATMCVRYARTQCTIWLSEYTTHTTLYTPICGVENVYMYVCSCIYSPTQFYDRNLIPIKITFIVRLVS